MGESWESCASREVFEETNLLIDDVHFSAVVNTPNMDGNPRKHYVTLFMTGRVTMESSPLVNNEPHKCESWHWMCWDEIVSIYQSTPQLLFEPVLKLIECNPQQPF